MAWGKILLGGAGVFASYLFGGWGHMLDTLLIFVIIDYLTGVMAAAADGQLKSKTGFIGIARKIFIFFIVAIAHLVDKSMNNGNGLIESAAIYFYLANELLSITENGGRLGVPIPAGISNLIEVLKGKGPSQ